MRNLGAEQFNNMAGLVEKDDTLYLAVDTEMSTKSSITLSNVAVPYVQRDGSGNEIEFPPVILDKLENIEIIASHIDDQSSVNNFLILSSTIGIAKVLIKLWVYRRTTSSASDITTTETKTTGGEGLANAIPAVIKLNGVRIDGWAEILSGPLVRDVDISLSHEGKLEGQRTTIDNQGNQYILNAPHPTPGGAGEIWFGTTEVRNRDPRPVAVKMYRQGKAAMGIHEQTVLPELGKRLPKANIVDVRDDVNAVVINNHGELVEARAIVMNKIPNAVNLLTYTQQERFTSREKVMSFFGNLFYIQRVAQVMGTAHPDLDGYNVMVEVQSSEDNEQEIPVLIDFDQSYLIMFNGQLYEVVVEGEHMLDLFQTETNLTTFKRSLLSRIANEAKRVAFNNENSKLPWEISVLSAVHRLSTSDWLEGNMQSLMHLDYPELVYAFITAEEDNELTLEQVKEVFSKYLNISTWDLTSEFKLALQDVEYVDWNSILGEYKTNREFILLPQSNTDTEIAITDLATTRADTGKMGGKFFAANPPLLLDLDTEYYDNINKASMVADYNIVFLLWRSLGLPFQYPLYEDSANSRIFTTSEYDELLRDAPQKLKGYLSFAMGNIYGSRGLFLIDELEFMEHARTSMLNGLEPEQLESIYALFKEFVENYQQIMMPGYVEDSSEVEYKFKAIDRTFFAKFQQIVQRPAVAAV